MNSFKQSSNCLVSARFGQCSSRLMVTALLLLGSFSCGSPTTRKMAASTLPIAASPALSPLLDGEETVCALPDESVLSRGGEYSTNVDLVSSVALPGTAGVDVVMTPFGAIAAVNTESGAALHWIDPASGETRLTRELPNPVSDIAFDGEETLAIADGQGVVVLSAASGDRLREVSLRGAKRVSIAADGHVAVIADKTVHLFDRDLSQDQQLFSKVRDYTEVTDVELLSCGNNSLVYVTSFQNAYFTDIENKRNPVQIARLEALDFSGNVAWSLFSNRTEEIKQNVADTRLYRVTLGRDGYLYIGGESAGTATIFRWQGLPLGEDEQYGRSRPFVTRTDANTQLHNSASAHITYYARVHPTKGELVTSQIIFPRLPDTKSNTMRIGDIATSEGGQLYFGGVAYKSIPNRDGLTLNGASVGSYEGGDRTWLSVSPNFRDRNFWTVLAEEGGKGIVQGVDAGYGYSAALSNVESGTVPVTVGAQSGSVFLSFVVE